VYCGDDDDDDHDFVDDNHDFVDDDHDIVDDDDDDHDIDAVISSITSHLSINFISSINLTHLIRLSISCIYLSHPSIYSISSIHLFHLIHPFIHHLCADSRWSSGVRGAFKDGGEASPQDPESAR